jgi:eukaryotic-like serine/threonine-protein kinase
MLDDKYRIERLIAAGGMGAVYLGTHIRLRKRVAIKVLNPQLSTAAMVERFHREAITASQIGHEGIAQVTDMGTSNEGEPFLVMEYLEGESLAKRLRTSGPLTVEEACEIGCAILSPLAAAHRAGIVHRDLKPDNVYLVRQSRGETVKLLDFGISRAPGLDSDFRLTNTGLVLGTPYYMSPEQARGESQITPAADLYAFGVMLYEMLVGDVPIRAENYNQLMYRVTVGDFERPRSGRPDLPEHLEQIILHAMAQAADARPASAADLEQALLPYCRPVFREHASGRISAPALSFKTPPTGNQIRPSSADANHEMFAGSTVSDMRLDEVHQAAADSGPNPAAGMVIQSDEHVARGSEPVLHAPAHDQLSPPASAAPRRSPARRMLPKVALIVMGVAVAVAGSLVLLLGDRGPVVDEPPVPPSVQPTDHTPGTNPPAATPTAKPVTKPLTKPAVHHAETITLSLAVEPPGAAIMLDGKRINKTELVVPKDTGTHRLQVAAAGYLVHAETISFDENQHLVIQLKHAPSAAHVGDTQNRDHSKIDPGDRKNQNDQDKRKPPVDESPYTP